MKINHKIGRAIWEVQNASSKNLQYVRLKITKKLWYSKVFFFLGKFISSISHFFFVICNRSFVFCSIIYQILIQCTYICCNVDQEQKFGTTISIQRYLCNSNLNHVINTWFIILFLSCKTWTFNPFTRKYLKMLYHVKYSYNVYETVTVVSSILVGILCISLLIWSTHARIQKSVIYNNVLFW